MMHRSIDFQVVSDLQKLLQSLNNGNSKFCCFKEKDIIIESVEFDEGEDPVMAARQVFVRMLVCIAHP